MVRWRSVPMFVLGLTVFAAAQNATAPSESAKGQDGAAPAGHVQLIPRSPEERERRYIATHRVVLDVQVTDGAGKAVVGLRPDDFTLLDNGQPRKIIGYRAVKEGDGPARILLVLDAINTPPAAFAKLRNGVVKFLTDVGSSFAHPVSIAVVTLNKTVQSPFSTDGIELSRQLGALTHKLHPNGCDSSVRDSDFTTSAAAVGFSAIHNVNIEGEDSECMGLKFGKSLHELGRLAAGEGHTVGRTLVIWAGAGWPLLAAPMFQADTAAGREQYFEYFSEMTRTLRESQVTLDFMAVNDLARQAELRSVNGPGLEAGAATAMQARAASLGPRFLAGQSGGRVLETDAKNLAGQLHDCVADADSYYVLSFDSVPSSAPNEYRQLQVKVSRPGANVRTAMFYFAQP